MERSFKFLRAVGAVDVVREGYEGEYRMIHYKYRYWHPLMIIMGFMLLVYAFVRCIVNFVCSFLSAFKALNDTFDDEFVIEMDEEDEV